MAANSTHESEASSLLKYDIFLSSRGKASMNFTDQLYHNLGEAGLKTFRYGTEPESESASDSEPASEPESPWQGEKEEGISPELLQAITESRISVIVFSKSYAASSGCLEQVVKIMECRRAVGQLVLPVFYDVEPSYVRKQTNAANIKGWHLKDGGEEVIIKEIIEEVLNYTSNTSFLGDSCALLRKYDVFLSFRGEDTRKNFTNHLYHALRDAGVKTFMDDIELRKGEDIATGLLKAIQCSRIAIVVLSRNYGDSKWCLNELVNIIERTESSGGRIFPTFYKVEPSAVRHQVKSFAEAFSKHESLFVAESNIQSWKAALQTAAEISGWVVKESYHASVIMRIVKTVLDYCDYCRNQEYQQSREYANNIEDDKAIDVIKDNKDWNQS